MRLQVASTYYAEIIDLVKEASGAERVFVFDHTCRESALTNLNAPPGGSAAPVPRVHCDYTTASAPRRLAQLGRDGIFSREHGRVLTEAEVEALGRGRYAFINAWRSVDDGPVRRQPLAVCDEASIAEADRLRYSMFYPERVGENYALRHSADHRWYYYPRCPPPRLEAPW